MMAYCAVIDALVPAAIRSGRTYSADAVAGAVYNRTRSVGERDTVLSRVVHTGGHMAGKGKGSGKNGKPVAIPMSRGAFLRDAKPLAVSIEGATVGYLMPRTFSSGKVGYHLSGKGDVTVGGKVLRLQDGFIRTVIDSDEWPESDGTFKAAVAINAAIAENKAGK